MDRERYSRLSAEKRHAKITKSIQNRLMKNIDKQGIGNLNFKPLKLHAKHSLVLIKKKHATVILFSLHITFTLVCNVADETPITPVVHPSLQSTVTQVKTPGTLQTCVTQPGAGPVTLGIAVKKYLIRVLTCVIHYDVLTPLC